MTTPRAIDDLLDTGPVDFITEHGLWSEEQSARADEVIKEVEDRGLESIRISFVDSHGLARGKTLTPRAFRSAMRNGVDCSPGPFFFDTGIALVSNPFQAGAGYDIGELTGAASVRLIPDPDTFKVLPWAATGWILADEYFKSGRPVPFSTRHLLRRLLDDLAGRGMGYVVGLEVEWFLTRLVDAQLTTDAIGGFGSPGLPPSVAPVDLGYQLNLEHLDDQLDEVLRPLRRALQGLHLPLRTTEHETGPGQLEFTFDPLPGLEAADAMVLFRNTVKQVCARRGYHATFMSTPGLPGYDASGWHLHQCLVDLDTGRNAFMPTSPGALVSKLGASFAGGLLEHASEATIFAVPTVNGYKRLSGRFKLSPDRATWSADNRGAYIRVLAGTDDPSSHLENRIGEPCANPYLYFASQLIAGMDGIDNEIDPGPTSDNPHGPDLPLLPTNLSEAIGALRASDLFRRAAGDSFVEYYTRLKDSEWRRYQAALAASDQSDDQSVVTDWEQREYFRVY